MLLKKFETIWRTTRGTYLVVRADPGTDHVAVDRLVDREHRAVERLERIGAASVAGVVAQPDSVSERRKRKRERRISSSSSFGGGVCDALSNRNWPIIFSSTTRRLRLRDRAAVGEHLRVAAGVEADVHLAEQSRREHRRDRVAAELVAVVHAHRDHRFVGLRIEPDAFDAADDDARRLDRRARLQSGDVVEARLEPVAGASSASSAGCRP